MMKIYSVKVLKVLGVLGFQKQIKDIKENETIKELNRKDFDVLNYLFIDHNTVYDSCCTNQR